MERMTQSKLFDTVEFFFSEESYYIPDKPTVLKLKEWWDYYVNKEYKNDLESFMMFCAIVLFIKNRLE